MMEMLHTNKWTASLTTQILECTKTEGILFKFYNKLPAYRQTSGTKI